MQEFSKSLPRVDTNVRVLHAVPTAPNVDVYVNGSIFASNLAFGKISKYITLTSGDYEFQIFITGNYDKPLLSQSISLVANTNYTISIVTLDDNLFLFKLNDSNISYNKSQSFLRFINLSLTSPLLSLSLPNNIILFNEAEYLETTGYSHLSSGIYNFELAFNSSDVSPKYIKNLTLNSGKFYTIYIIGLFNDKPPLGYLLTDDLI